RLGRSALALTTLFRARRFLLGAAGLLSASSLGAHAMPMASGPFRLRLLDAHTGATFDGAYRDAGGPIARVMDELCQFLRDHHSELGRAHVCTPVTVAY